jgi:(p)ppGpp synthase/HD superfamily hydrolase
MMRNNNGGRGKDMNLFLEKALEIMLRFHRGQTDLGGEPYILHPLRVMEKVESMDAKIVALLHDVIEDSWLSRDGMVTLLRDEYRMPADIIRDVVLLTRKEDETYEQYIRGIRESGRERAIMVKRADLADNMTEERMGRLPSETRKSLLMRYSRAVDILDGRR